MPDINETPVVKAILAADKFTGYLRFDEAAASIYFIFGGPSHAEAVVGTETVVGKDALKHLSKHLNSSVRRLQGSSKAVEIAGKTREAIVEFLAAAALTRPQTAVAPSPPDAETTAPPESGATATPTNTLHALPLLPAGEPLFERLGIATVNIEALAGEMLSGAIRVVGEQSEALILVNEHRIHAAFYRAADGTISRDDHAVKAVKLLKKGAVSAHLLSSGLVTLIPQVLETPVVYEQLQLEWLNWKSLLQELVRRDGVGLVEIETSVGKAVILIQNQDAVAYSDLSPFPGDPDELIALLSPGVGSVTVHHSAPPAPWVEEVPVAKPVAPKVVAPTVAPPEPAETPEPLPEEAAPAPALPEVAEPVVLPLPVPEPTNTESGGGGAFDVEHEPNDEPFSSDWEKRYDTASNSERFPRDEMVVAIENELRASAPKLLPILDRAESEGWTSQRLQEEVQALPIRGIQPARMATLGADLAAILARE